MIDTQGGVLLLKKQAGEEVGDQEACSETETEGNTFYTLSQFRLHTYIPEVVKEKSYFKNETEEFRIEFMKLVQESIREIDMTK